MERERPFLSEIGWRTVLYETLKALLLMAGLAVFVILMFSL